MNIGKGGDHQDELRTEDRVEWKDESKIFRGEYNREEKSGDVDGRRNYHPNRGAPGSNIIETEPPKEQIK